MASGFIKMATIVMVLNIFMYLGVNFAINAEGTAGLNEEYNFYFKGDLLDIMLGDNTDAKLNQIVNDTKDGWTSYGIDTDSSLFNEPEQQAGEVIGEGGVSLLDGIKIMWAIIPTMANIVIAPLTLFFNFNMPIFIGLMIGLPYLFILGVSLYAMIGGRE